MMLLRFTVRNHKSIRDELTLDLTRPSLRTLQPRGSDWRGVTYRVAGIFGGNATGKSTVIDALHYAMTAIEESSTSWQAARSMQRAPFRLNPETREACSMYELEFVFQDRRHLYGFEVDSRGIRREWLRDVPTVRWRTLLERDRENGLLRPSLEITDRELALSRSLQLPKSPFHEVAKALVANFDVVLVHHAHREVRLKAIADMLAEGSITFDDLQLLLQVADIGVAKVSLEERDLPEHVRAALSSFFSAIAKGEQHTGTVNQDASSDLDEPLQEKVVRHLLFSHQGADDDCEPFSISDESDGTVAWLATAVPALEVLRNGGLLLVDEVDASLHPHLLDLLIGMFSDEEVNTQGSQLIFTSHESYILSPLSEVELEPEQVWFTDKDFDGATQLTCLADFPRHPDANVAKRYLTGRYGGTPRLSPSLFAALATSSTD